MTVVFHEQMHFAIWNWIREYSDSHEPRMPSTPKDILVEIISKIPHVNPAWHPDAIAPSYLSDTGNISDMLGTFSEQMCTVAEHLYQYGFQQRLSWYDMKKILQFYISDITEYIDHINSLGWNYHQMNSYFDLNLNDLNLPPSVMVQQLLWSRYLTGTKIFHVNNDPSMRTPRFETELLARGEDYWGPRVLWEVYSIQDGVRFIYNPGEGQGEEEEDEQVSKKKEALKKIQAIVDEVSDDIGDGAYLKLMNVMKEEWSS